MIACTGGGQIYSLGVGTTFDLSQTPLNYQTLTTDNFILIPKSIGWSANCRYIVDANNYSYACDRDMGTSGSLNPVINYDSTTGALSISNTTSAGSTGNYNNMNENNKGSKATITSSATATYEVLVVTGDIVSI